MSDRYSRQIALPEIGEEGQERLGKSHVTIVGVGALGSVMAELLARAGVGKLTLIDFDMVELNNLARQGLYTTADVGQPKVDAAKQRIEAINPDVLVEAKMEHLEQQNLDLLEGTDLVLDGTDNLETRFLLNEACYGKRPVIYTSAVMDKGSVFPVLASRACYACIFWEKRNTENCCEHGVLNGATHLAGTISATEGLKLLLDMPAMEGLFSFSLFDNRFELLKVARQEGCPVCGRA